QALRFDAIEPHQVLPERVHQAVERLVRRRLALEAAARQDERPALVGVVEEAAHQRGLAHARLAVNEAYDRASLSCGAERLVERGEVALAADQPRRAVRRGAARRRRRRTGVAAEPAQDVAPRRTRRRLAA